LLVAFLTEHIFHNPAAVGHSMAIVGTVSLLIGTGFGFLAAKRFHVAPSDATPSPAPQ
jgi:hypothetical protein